MVCSVNLNREFCSVVLLVLLTMVGCAEQAEPPEEHPGLQTYMKYCASCHNAGVAEAPKLGDRDKWKWRIEKGRDVLLESTINGMPPGMPIRGLCLSCSDAELDEAIDYMLVEVGEPSKTASN